MPSATTEALRAMAAVYQERVFAQHGARCYFCGEPAAKAMLIIPARKLGRNLYVLPEFNGRPGCESCYERNNRYELQFSVCDVRAAVHALNLVLPKKLKVPKA